MGHQKKKTNAIKLAKGKYKTIDNDRQNTALKSKDWATRVPL